MKEFLIKKDPFPTIPCEESYCPLCTDTPHTILSNKKNNIPCDTLNVGYKWRCTGCHKVYEGETGRTVRLRTKEHLRDLTKENLSSPLVKHVVEDHGGQPTKFTVETTKKFFDALSRQADEGVRIYKNQENVINLKSEFNHPPIKRISLEKRNKRGFNSIPRGPGSSGQGNGRIQAQL